MDKYQGKWRSSLQLDLGAHDQLTSEDINKGLEGASVQYVEQYLDVERWKVTNTVREETPGRATTPHVLISEDLQAATPHIYEGSAICAILLDRRRYL